ncbi:MAG: hypothetical protein ACJAUC_002245, partial [Planctomycetota bacterium]
MQVVFPFAYLWTGDLDESIATTDDRLDPALRRT